MMSHIYLPCFQATYSTTHNAGDPRVFPRKRMVYTRSANAEFFFHVLFKTFFVVLINVSCAFMACCHILG